MPRNNEQKQEESFKAGALLCPVCCVEYIEVEVDFEVDNTILKNVKLLRCPACQEERFTPEQQADIEDQMRGEG